MLNYVKNVGLTCVVSKVFNTVVVPVSVIVANVVPFRSLSDECFHHDRMNGSVLPSLPLLKIAD